MNHVAVMDKQLNKRKELLESSTVTRIYCDASFKNNIMVSGIVVIGPGHNDTICKNIVDHKDNVLSAEIEAIMIALKYVKDNYIREAIIYTEIDDVLHAYPFLVVLKKTTLSTIPREHQQIAKQYYEFWRYFRYVHNADYKLTIDKVKSIDNPAHSIVCKERDRILKNRNNKNPFKNSAKWLGNILVKWGNS